MMKKVDNLSVDFLKNPHVLLATFRKRRMMSNVPQSAPIAF
jgi:hypothetical protein